MPHMKLFLKLFISILLLAFGIRLYECIALSLNHHIPNLLKYEVVGLLQDIGLSSLLAVFLFPIHALLNKISQKLAIVITGIILVAISIIYLGLLQYFISQLKPLDTFIYLYQWSEIWFTIKTTELNYWLILPLFAAPIGILVWSWRYFEFKHLSKKKVLLACSLIGLSIISLPYTSSKDRKYCSNKLAFFAQKSFTYFLNKSPENDDSKALSEYQRSFDNFDYIHSSHPFLHRFKPKNVLGKYLNKGKSKPNIVIIIIEGLGDKFIHSYHGMYLMPFMESLSKQSLYWNHFLTVGERSFAASPSLLGSLPYDKKGFTFSERMPYHYSLINVLKANDYYTSFYYGQPGYFHKKEDFCKNNHIHRFVSNENYPAKYHKIIVGDYFWGYEDLDLFNHSLHLFDSTKAKQRLDVYFTGTTHNPFIFEDVGSYTKQIQKDIDELSSNADKDFLQSYTKQLASLRYADDVFKHYFDEIKKRDGFENTIFIITGDHPMTEIPIENSLKRYHVPLIIYSPLLKEAKTFDAISSHLDVYESLLSLLHEDYAIKVPPLSSALGEGLDTSAIHSLTKKIAFMDDNREIRDFLSDGFYISGEDSYQVLPGFELQKTNESQTIDKIRKELSLFKAANAYVAETARLIDDSLFFVHLGIKLKDYATHENTDSSTAEYRTLIEKTPVIPQEIVFDYNTNYVFTGKNAPLVVSQITDEKDSVLEWHSFEMKANGHQIKLTERFKTKALPGKTYYFSALVYNPKNSLYETKQEQVILYEDY